MNNRTYYIIHTLIRSLSIALVVNTTLHAEAKAPADIPDTLARRVDLSEVVVRPRKEKYTKKHNKAVDLVELIRRNAEIADPYQNDYYGYEKYECITLALNNVTDSIGEKGGLLGQFKFLNEYVDTSSVTGKPILPLSVKERVSDIYYRKSPKAHKERVIGVKNVGLDDSYNQQSIQTYLNDMFRDIDLYHNDITLLSNRFVSPLSRIGPDFYKYYLNDTIYIDGDTCAVLSFVPRNNATFGFIGNLYVSLADSTRFIKRASMNLSKNANVNFIKSLRIDQSYRRDSSGVRLKTLDDLAVEFEVIPGTQGIYAHKHTTMRDHNFSPAENSEIYERLGDMYIAADSYMKDENFFDARRDSTFRRNQREIGTMIGSMRAVPAFYYAEKVLKIVVSGYIPVSGDKIEIGQVNTFLSFNDVEGTRLKFGGITTARLNRHWFFRGYGAYGTKDRKMKYYGEAEYSFKPKENHSREFPIHSLRMSYGYDKEAIGQHYTFTNPDNIFLSLKRMPDTLMIYRRAARLAYTLELENNFSVVTTVNSTRDEPSRYVHFDFSDGSSLSHLDYNTASISLRYAPGEKFMQTKSQRIPVNLDAPVFMLTHTIGPSNFLGSSRYLINKTEFDFQKRFWFSAFGYADLLVKGGHVWNAVPFTHLLMPNANLSYTIQPESFALLSPMEFIFDSYASVDFTYNANGAIFNYIPLFKKLRLREVFAFRGTWGKLSDKNNPATNGILPLFPAMANPVAMGDTPYMEVSAGIDNLLRILRVDYVWRLTYRSTPGVDKSGLRIALHFTF